MYVMVPTVPAVASRAAAASSFQTRPIVTGPIRLRDRAGSAQGVAGATSGAGTAGSGKTSGASFAGSSGRVAAGDGTTKTRVPAAALTSTLAARNMARDPKVS